MRRSLEAKSARARSAKGIEERRITRNAEKEAKKEFQRQMAARGYVKKSVKVREREKRQKEIKLQEQKSKKRGKKGKRSGGKKK